MYFKILRGTHEIGGSCVEVWTNTTRILVDFGMPLVDKNQNAFDFREYKSLEVPELIKAGILPDVKGLYGGRREKIDGVIISHPHQDHFGLMGYVDNNVRHYLGRATHTIIELNNLFTPQEINIQDPMYFEREVPFRIGDITITPYWADHSAFDAYAFLIEADGKRIFYSGDFRNHGRKSNAFKWFLHHAPQHVDYLLLEGTTIGRENKKFLTEAEIETQLIALFKNGDGLNLIYASGQNIDRIVSAYRACLQTGKTMVVDVYIAKVLKALSAFANIPFPSDDYHHLKVMFPFYLSRRLKNRGHKEVLYEFKKFKITKQEIADQKNSIVMFTRPSMQKDLEHIDNIEGGNLIYSMWDGYLKSPETVKFIDYLTSHNFTIHKIHTSGHADIETLKQMVNAIKPNNIIPIHTFNGNEYKNLFPYPVIELNDKEVRHI